MKPGFEADTIIHRLAHWARRRGDSAAIIDGDVRVSYGELDGASLTIARQIMAAAEGRRGNVCLLFSDKSAAIKAIFGAMRSANACVALDAGDPEERLRFIVDDSAPVAVLTERTHFDRARALVGNGCPVIDAGSAQRQEETSALPLIDPDQLAYVSYTSGSTGTPKGVMQTHGNLLFFIDSYRTGVGMGASDRLSVLSALGVPAALGDILRGIALGAALCLYDMRRRGIGQLADWLDRHRVTVFHSVPTVFREMTSRMAERRVLPHLRVVHLGGEAVFAGDVERFLAHTLPHCVLFNQLACTEISVVARNIIGHGGFGETEGAICVGRPIDGVHVEILDDDGNAAAPRDVGEMVVSSAHASPGYWRRPMLDAAAFSADPAHDGWRRYRSGDLGRIDAAGNLWFHGRTGTRVKVHGHSVDLMEVEAALATCAGVLRAAVLADEAKSQTDSVRLVAYLEVDAGDVRDPATPRRHLASRLPSYMLPADIRYVDAMPLTVGGKIDRNRLGAMTPLPTQVNPGHEPPRDDIEREVARAFEALLHLDAVGVGDDFFLIGGDSLLGAELQVRLARTFGVRVGDFHEDATVAGIAAGIRRERARPAAQVREMPIMLPLWRCGSEVPLFIVHGRHGQAFVSPHFMRLLGDDQPVWSFQARGLDGVSEPHASVEAMADEYLAQMRSVRPSGPYFLGALCAGVFIVTVMARRLREAGETVLPLLLLDPPNSVFQPGYLGLTQQQFERKMRARKAEGGSGGPLDDPSYVQALIRTVAAFERAIALHQPLPYDGDVFMLSSTARVQGADAPFFDRMFPGNVVRHEIGATHRHAMHPQNPAFVRALAESLARIRGAAEAQGDPSLARRRHPEMHDVR